MTIQIIEEAISKKRNHSNDGEKCSDAGKRMCLNHINDSDLPIKTKRSRDQSSIMNESNTNDQSIEKQYSSNGMIELQSTMKIKDLPTISNTSPLKIDGFESDSNPKSTTNSNLELSTTITATQHAVNQNLVYLLGNNNNNTGLKQIIATTTNWRLNHINDRDLSLKKKRSCSQSPPRNGNEQPIERQLRSTKNIKNLPTTNCSLPLAKSITGAHAVDQNFSFFFRNYSYTNNNNDNNNGMSNSCVMLPTTNATTPDSIIIEEDTVSSRSRRRSRRDMDCSTSSRKISMKFNKELKDLIKALARLTIRENSENHHKPWRNKQPSDGVMASPMEIEDLPTTTTTITNTPPRTDGFKFYSPPPSERDCQSEIDCSPPVPKRSRFSI